MTLRRGGASRRGAVRHARHRRLATRRRGSPARYKGGGVGPVAGVLVLGRASSRSRSIRRPAGSHVPKVWIAHDIGRALNPVLARGQVEGSVYMGLGEALMEEQAFRRLPPKLSQRARAQVPVDARVQEPDHARHAGGRSPYLVEDPDRERPVRRQGSRPGAAAAGDAGGRQRGLRRGRRAHRRGADHAGEDPARRSRRRRRASPRATARTRFPEVPYPEPIDVPPPWEGGDGKATKEPRTRERAARSECG